jgi:UDP-N-acetylmuramoyl-tripeptide--D-alanyl-D-alanine ligase
LQEARLTEPLWTAQEIARSTGGVAKGDFVIHGIDIDSRGLSKGDLFVALAGARDGHDFIDQAMANGAAGALVSRQTAAPNVQVVDTLRGLEALGLAARDRSSALRCAVTGSVGKTSVTQAIAAGLALAGRSHSSIKSFNNHIGVPLTLARMPIQTQRAVFEIGMNHAEEITPLVQMVQPQAVAITTVGPVHIENFPDGEAGVARAKAEIFDGLAPNGIAVLNADNEWFGYLQSQARLAGARVLDFGSGSDCAARLTGFEVRGARARVTCVMHGEPVQFDLRQTGLHWGLNGLCALLMLEAMDVDRQTALAALADFEPLAGRGAEALLQIAGGTATLIDESYNANPLSMTAALRTLGARPVTGRRIAVLTDMLELGPDGPAMHAALVDPLVEAGVDQVFVAGPQMKSLWDALPATRRGGYALTAVELAPKVAEALSPGDVIMVKGSNGSRAGLIAAALLQRYRTGGEG